MPAHPPSRPPASGRPTILNTRRQPTSHQRPGAAPARGGARRPHGASGQSLEDRVKRDPELLARALNDPGLRSKLPDRYLSADQLKTRRNQQMVRNIGDISQPLTGDSLVNTAQTLTDREFAPLLEDIGRSEADVQRRRDEQARRAAGYFGSIGQQQGATIAGQEAATAQAIQAAGQRQAATMGGVNAAATAASDRASHDAAVRGADLGGGSIEQMAADHARAQMQAGTEGQAAADSASAAGGAQAAFLRGTAAATAQAGGETQGQIGARGDNALADLAASRAKLNADRKGQFTDTLLKMRQGEVDRSLTERGLANDQEKALLDFKQQMATLKSKAQIEKANRDLKVRLTGMGLDAKAAQAEADRATQEAIAAGNNATSRANTATTSATSASNNAATNATSAANNQRTTHQSDVNSRRSAAGRGAGGFNHKDRVDAAGKRDDAIGMAQSYKKSRASRDTALQLLTEKYGSDYARVAVGAIYDGGAKPHLDALLAQRYGIHVPGKYRTH